MKKRSYVFVMTEEEAMVRLFRYDKELWTKWMYWVHGDVLARAIIGGYDEDS
jgi:hypothetical protein